MADLGLVVFVPTWGQQGSGTGPYPSYDYARAFDAQAACAVAFAGAHATEYGGDPARMIVFGFSAGANFAAMVPLARPEPSPGCLAGAPLGAVDSLVIYDGDWFPLDSSWDSMIAANPAILDAATPWRYLPDHRDLRVVMLGSELAGPYVRPLGDAAPDAFFAVRDPSGDRRRRLEAMGALADNQVSIVEEQQLLFSVPAAQGNRVSLDFMPGATHDDGIRGAGWDILLAAFEKALAND